MSDYIPLETANNGETSFSQCLMYQVRRRQAGPGTGCRGSQERGTASTQGCSARCVAQTNVTSRSVGRDSSLRPKIGARTTEGTLSFTLAHAIGTGNLRPIAVVRLLP